RPRHSFLIPRPVCRQVQAPCHLRLGSPRHLGARITSTCHLRGYRLADSYHWQLSQWFGFWRCPLPQEHASADDIQGRPIVPSVASRPRLREEIEVPLQSIQEVSACNVRTASRQPTDRLP